MLILKMSLIIISFTACPIMTGLLVNKVLGIRERLSSIYLTGLVFIFALYELLYIPMVLTYQSLTLLTAVWGAVVIIACVTGIILNHDVLKQELKLVREKAGTINKMEAAALLLVAVYVILALLNQQRYEDDTIFLAWSSTSYKTDTLVRFSPYTGREITIYDSNMPQYLMAGYSVFVASIAGIFSVAPVIVMHIGIPIIFIPVTYMIYYMIARLFAGRKVSAAVIAMLVVINSFSIYASYELTTSAWLHVGAWYGKSLSGNIIFPLVWYYAIMAMDTGMMKYGGGRNWIKLWLTTVSAFFVSTFGSIAVPSLLAGLVLYYMIRNRRISYLLYYIATVCPALCVIAIRLVML